MSFIRACDSVNVLSRGLLPNLARSAIIAASRSFVSRHIFAFFAKIGPQTDLEEPVTGFSAITRWLWAAAPQVVIQNLLMILTYPALLATTIAIVPGVRPSK